MTDPWDFVSENGTSRLGTIVAEAKRRSSNLVPVLRIELDDNVRSAERSGCTVFATFRHAGDWQQNLLAGQHVPSNFSSEVDVGEGISAGCLSFIGTLKLLT